MTPGDQPIFVIVMNQDVIVDGQNESFEEIYDVAGYFFDEKAAEEKVNELNAKYIQELKNKNGYDYKPTDEEETTFGFIPLLRSDRDTRDVKEIIPVGCCPCGSTKYGKKHYPWDHAGWQPY